MAGELKYRLYAMPLGEESVSVATRERFSRIAERYVLIYTTAEQPTASAEIEAKEIKRLSAADEKWLFDCNIVILAAETQKHQAELLDSLSKKIGRLEKALAEEKSKREEGVS